MITSLCLCICGACWLLRMYSRGQAQEQENFQEADFRPSHAGLEPDELCANHVLTLLCPDHDCNDLDTNNIYLTISKPKMTTVVCIQGVIQGLSFYPNLTYSVPISSLHLSGPVYVRLVRPRGPTTLLVAASTIICPINSSSLFHGKILTAIYSIFVISVISHLVSVLCDRRHI